VVAVAAGANAIGGNAANTEYSLTFVPKVVPLVAGTTYGIPSGIALQVSRVGTPEAWYGGVGADVGTFTVTGISAGRITATFSGVLPPLGAGTALTIANGNIDASLLTQPSGLVGVQFSATNSPLYGIDSASGAGTLLGSTGFARLNSLARNAAGALVSASITNPGSSELITINPSTGAGALLTAISFGATVPDIRGLAYSPADVLFAIQEVVGGSDILYTINPANGVGTIVGATGLPGLQGLDFSPSGQLFGWDVGLSGSNGAGLVTINTTTGVATDVNPAVGGIALQSIAFHSSGTLYGAVDSQLYSINPTTGAATLIGGSGFAGLRGIEFTN
jgi:hypothetical protein